MYIKTLLSFVLTLFFLMAPALAADSPRVAVLELQGELPATSLALLSDKVRAGVLEATEGRDVVVMSRENMAVLAKDMGLELDCIEGACEVETGRNIGAAYVVSGSVSQMAGTWICTVKIHKTDTGALLATGDARAPDQLTLLDGVAPMVGGLTKKAFGGQFNAAAGGGAVSSVSGLYLGDDIDNAFSDEKGFLFITTEPEDAEVLLNGEVIGSGGAVQKEVMVGRYVLAVRHPGPYHAYVSQPFELGTDGHKQKIDLKAAFGTLRVQSDPSGAEVWIAGKRVGTTPYRDARYPSGQVQLKLTKSFYASASKTVTVQDEQTTEVDIALSQNFGTLTVKSSPEGAEILFGKKSTGKKTPHTFEQLPPGVYAVGLKLYGYLDDFKKIDLKVGDKTTHSVDFEQAMGQMVLTSEDLHGKPCEGVVKVGDKEVGTTPYKGMAQVGTHEVQVRCGSDWVLKKVTIKHNDAVRQEFSMVESKARNARLTADKRQRSAAKARSRRAFWSGIFANADEDAVDQWLYYYALGANPTFHQTKFSFKPDDAQMEWLMVPFSAILSNGVDWWVDERLLLGLDIPMYAQPWGLTKSLTRGKREAPFGDFVWTFNPTLKLGFRPLGDYQRFHAAVRYTTHFSFGGEQIANIGMRSTNESETVGDQLVLNIFDLEVSHQPQPLLVLSPTVRYLMGTAYGLRGSNPTTYKFGDLAAGGRLAVPVDFGGIVFVGEGWYFQGPLGKSTTDLSKYQDYGARVYMKVDIESL
jgi:hypothetical protein